MSTKEEKLEAFLKRAVNKIELKNDGLLRREAMLKLALVWVKYVTVMDSLLEAVKETEKGVYRVTIKEANLTGIVAMWSNNLFIDLYSDHLRRVLVNLDPTSHVSNVDIKTIVSRHSYVDLANLTSEELSPTVWEPIFEEQKKKEEALAAAKTTKNKDNLIKCRKCHSKNVHVQTQQLRSADEGMTNIITCQDCGHIKKS